MQGCAAVRLASVATAASYVCRMAYRVLIVDDEAGIRQALKQVLEYEDLEVRVPASGGEALTVYPSSGPTWCSST